MDKDSVNALEMAFAAPRIEERVGESERKNLVLEEEKTPQKEELMVQPSEKNFTKS